MVDNSQGLMTYAMYWNVMTIFFYFFVCYVRYHCDTVINEITFYVEVYSNNFSYQW